MCVFVKMKVPWLFQITKYKSIYKVYGLFFSSVYLLEIIFGFGCYLPPFSSTHSKIYIFLFFGLTQFRVITTPNLSVLLEKD